MSEAKYNNLKEIFGVKYADAARRLEHSGSKEALEYFMNVRKEVIDVRNRKL